MKKTILIVDDEPEVLKAVSQLVRAEGYDVMLAESGDRALGILTRRSFDLILTDLMMPGINGWQLLEAAKREYPDTKVVVLTGYIDQQGESILVDRNADGYLVKPIDVAKLRALLSNLLDGDEVIGAHVSVVDDDRITLTMVEGVLAEHGILVNPFTSPGAALQHALDDRPHLFIVDLQMPEVSGFDFIKQIRDTTSLSDIPVIVLTGSAERGHVSQAVALGVSGFVAKPYDANDLVTKVKKAIAGAR